VHHADLPAAVRLQLRIAAQQPMGPRGEEAAAANNVSPLGPWLDTFQAQTLFRSLPPVGSQGWLLLWCAWVLRCIATVIPIAVFAGAVMLLMPIIFTTIVVEFLAFDACESMGSMLRELCGGDFAAVRRRFTVPSVSQRFIAWRIFLVALVVIFMYTQPQLSCAILTLSGLAIVQLPLDTPQHHISINGNVAKCITLLSAVCALLPLMLPGSTPVLSANDM
jgi:hypothetical protein